MAALESWGLQTMLPMYCSGVYAINYTGRT